MAKRKKGNWINKDELLKSHEKICWAKRKNVQLFNNGVSEDKKAKCTKKCARKRKPKFENSRNCLKTTQLENKASDIEQNKIDIDRIKGNHSELLKRSKSILKHSKYLKVKGIIFLVKKLIRPY